MMSPPLSCGIWIIDIWMSGSLPRRSRRRSHSVNSHSTRMPLVMNTIVGETPPTEGPPGFGSTKPHSLDRSTPNTARPRPSADSTAPKTSSCGRGSTGASTILRESSRITITTSTSPANTHRHEAYVVASPPISGPTATATAPAAATNPYARGRSSVWKFEATSATIAGMISAAPTPSRNDQPKISTPSVFAIEVVNEPHP
jgi:hypothetical protein